MHQNGVACCSVHASEGGVILGPNFSLDYLQDLECGMKVYHNGVSARIVFAIKRLKAGEKPHSAMARLMQGVRAAYVPASVACPLAVKALKPSPGFPVGPCYRPL